MKVLAPELMLIEAHNTHRGLKAERPVLEWTALTAPPIPICPRAGVLTFEAPRDVEEAISIQTAHVTRVQPAFGINGLTCFVLHV